MAKLETSESRGKWNYLIKNLILIDRMLEERYFVREISEIEIDYVENFTDPTSKIKIFSYSKYIF